MPSEDIGSELTGAGAPPEPDERGCFDGSRLPYCSPAPPTFGPPQTLLAAAQLGAEFRFVSINQNIVLGRGSGGRARGAAVFGSDAPARFFDLDASATTFEGAELLVLDAIQTFVGDERRFSVLACTGEVCSLLRPSALDSEGFPAGPLEDAGPVFGGWSPRGLFNEDSSDGVRDEVCAFGQGIRCLEGGVWNEVLPAAESGEILRVEGRLALTADGRVFRWVQPRTTPSSKAWLLDSSSDRFDRLTLGGATRADGTWLAADGAAPRLCVRGVTPIGSSTRFGMLDATGAIYSHDWQMNQECRWPETLPDAAAIVDESELACGLSANWVVLTSERLVAVLGPSSCITD